MYQKAREKKERAEQRISHRSVVNDLRSVYNATRQRAREEQAAKERLRQLRQELEPEEAEDAPWLTEADSAEVLGEDEDDLSEAELVVPVGFSICSEPPWEEALKFSKPISSASKGLEGRRIFQKYDLANSNLAPNPATPLIPHTPPPIPQSPLIPQLR